MSKLDAQRAMREAKYARDRASGPPGVRRQQVSPAYQPKPLRDPCPDQHPERREQARPPPRPRSLPTRRPNDVATGR